MGVYAAATAVTVPNIWVVFAVGTLSPILVGLITKVAAPTWLKQLVGAVVALVAALAATSVVVDGQAVFASASMLTAAMGWVAQQAMFLGIWEPHSLNDRTFPKRGLG